MIPASKISFQLALIDDMREQLADMDTISQDRSPTTPCVALSQTAFTTLKNEEN